MCQSSGLARKGSRKGNVFPWAELQAVYLTIHFVPGHGHKYISILIYGQLLTIGLGDQGLMNVVVLTINPRAEFLLPIHTTWSFASLED